MTVTTTAGDREPEPGIEAAIAAGMRGELDFPAVMRVFAGWPIILPSKVDFRTVGGGPQPIILDSATPGSPPMVAVFTSRDRLGAWEEVAPHMLVAPGAVLMRGVQGGAGVVINPGSPPATELTPQGIPVIGGFPTDIDPLATPGRPLSPLEVALARRAAGTATLEQLVDVLRVSEVYAAGSLAGVYSITASPIDVDGRPYVGIFTNPDFIRPQMGWAEETISIPVPKLVEQAGSGVGFVINPMSSIWFALHPEVAAQLVS